MSYVLSEGAMEKLINDVADVRAGQAFLKQSFERMEEKLDKALDEHDERIRAPYQAALAHAHRLQ